MPIGLFTDKSQQPTEDEITAALGERLPLWQEFIRFLRERYPSEEDFHFLYGKNHGWALRFRAGTKLLTALYPTAGGFTVQINLPPAAIEQAQGMALGQNVQQAIARAYPYPEGRWLFIPVESAADLDDIRQLLALRVEHKRIKFA